MDNGMVNLPGGNQDNISWLQLIRFSFDHIADISLEKDEKLMKIMVVTLEFPALPGGEIEKAEICIQITGFWRQLLLIFHSGSFQASGILGGSFQIPFGSMIINKQ